MTTKGASSQTRSYRRLIPRSKQAETKGIRVRAKYVFVAIFVGILLVGTKLTTSHFLKSHMDEPAPDTEQIAGIESASEPAQPSKTSPGQLLRMAVQAYSEGNNGMARELSARAREMSKDTAELAKICNFQGILEFEAKNNPEAVAHFLTAIRHEPKNGGHYFNWAEALRAEGHARAALAPMMTAAAYRPNDLLTKIKLNLLLIETGQAETLAAKINELSGQGDITVDVAFAKAALLRLGGQNEELQELLSKLKEITPAEVFSIAMNDRVFRVVVEPPGKQDSTAVSSE